MRVVCRDLYFVELYKVELTASRALGSPRDVCHTKEGPQGVTLVKERIHPLLPTGRLGGGGRPRLRRGVGSGGRAASPCARLLPPLRVLGGRGAVPA